MTSIGIDAHRTLNDGINFDGIPIHASKNLHRDVFAEIIDSALSGRILELGSGSGAFAERLSKAGFDVTASDLDGDWYKADVPFTQADLNGDFSNVFGTEAFDVIVALETIEHLENPKGFLKQAKKILRSGGSLCISFPNAYTYSVVLAYLRSGTLVNWNAQAYQDWGHQAILFDWLIEQMAEEIGFEVRKKRFLSKLNLREHYPNPVKRMIVWVMIRVMKTMSPAMSLEKRYADNVFFQLVKKP